MLSLDISIRGVKELIGPIDHVAVTVADMERSVRFYRDVMGFKVLGRVQPREGFTIVCIGTGNDAFLELFHFASGSKPLEFENSDVGLKHIAFKVDDVEGIAAKLHEHNVEFTVEPTSAKGGIRVAFFKDPDGNLLEIIHGSFNNLQPYNP